MVEIVSLAVLRGDPPEVFVADDVETLHRLLALRVVAQTPPSLFGERELERVRGALIDERWGAAVEEWIRASGEALDVYESWDLLGADDVELIGAELQFSPLFHDPS